MSTKSLLTGVLAVLGIFAITAQNSYALEYVTQLPEPGSNQPPLRWVDTIHPNSAKTVRPNVTPQPRYYASRDVYRKELTRKLAPYGSTRSNYLDKMKQTQRKQTVNAPRSTGQGNVGHVSGGMIRDLPR